MIESLLPHLRDPRQMQRAFHGRGGVLPQWKNLVIDAYPPYVLLFLYGPLPVGWEDLVQGLSRYWNLPREQFIVQDRTNSPWQILLTAPDRDKIICQEEGLSFEIHPFFPQNPGLFLDTRPFRTWLKENSQGKKILNLFSYTCSLSVAALSGGALQVDNWDMKKGPLTWGRENHRLNHIPLDRVRFFCHDIFKSWGKIKGNGPYNLVIADPPPGQKFFNPHRDWPKLLNRAEDWLAPQGLLVAILNSPDTDWDQWQGQVETGRSFTLVEKLTSGPDFPEAVPGRGLKIGIFQKNS